MQTFDPVAFIATKRDGREHPAGQVAAFSAGIVAGQVADYQAAAWLMAAYLQDLSEAETIELTMAIADSGQRLQWPGVDRPVVDKHSSGGVGDKTSLVVVPLAAACGLAVPKLSGRGLGITGGTLDKLESIPGLNVHLSSEQFQRQVVEIGLAIAAQAPDLAPVDGVLYGIRDVTATVGSIPLIAASIMGKKLAAGASTLALDVKCGTGATISEMPIAESLAKLMIRIGEGAGIKTRAYLTDMDAPLGTAVGNSLEVAEALDILGGQAIGPVGELAITIVAGLLRDSGLRSAPRAARSNAETALRSGKALVAFEAMVSAQSGDIDAFRASPPHAAVEFKIAVRAEGDGYIQSIDAARIGGVARMLGAGRASKDSAIDSAVGITLTGQVGGGTSAGRELALIYARSQGSAERAAAAVKAAIVIGAEPPLAAPLLKGQFVSSAG